VRVGSGDLNMQCRNCRKQNPEDANFCNGCGARLPVEATAAIGERRQLTVVFCDVVKSTPLAKSLDPEEWQEITAAYYEACETVICRHDGYVAEKQGDGIKTYFGFPKAHEDDPCRAVRAGLEIITAVAELTTEVQKQRRISLSARVGIHTGEVALKMGLPDAGVPLHLASRIQHVATPGTVVVSDATYRIARGFFEFTPLHPSEIKGFPEVDCLYRALQESGAVSRLDVARRTGLTPLTGRDTELALLEERWQSVSMGKDCPGHAVLLNGEAGIGKSRIVDALRERVAHQTATILECSCTPYAQNTPLFPIVELAERTLGFTRETTDADKRTALNNRLAERGLLTHERAALMAGLLGIPAGKSDPLVNYEPQKRHQRTLETLVDWLSAVVQERPALLVVEDLHWADPTTIEFLSSVLHSLSKVQLLLLLTYRPESFTAPWEPNGHVSSIALTRLDANQASSIAARVAGGGTIPSEFLSRIVARAEGVPLYVEEITKLVLEEGLLVKHGDRYEISRPWPDNLIPPTVYGPLDARRDRLGAAKETAQLAAIIGREFSYALLRAVASENEVELRRRLDRLIASELVYRRADTPEETYRFKHELMRDAAYYSMQKRSRRPLHLRLADALTREFPEMASQHPELVAKHLTAAERWGTAVKFWLRGGKTAVRRGANHEASAHLNSALKIVTEASPGKRYRQELELQIALFPALIAAQGWASPEFGRVLRRAQELVDHIGNTQHRFRVLAFTMGYHFVAGRVTQALELADQVLGLATLVGHPLLLTIGRQDCSAAYCYHGDFRIGIEHAKAGLAMRDLDRERDIGQEVGLSPCVGMRGYAYLAQWMRGFPDHAEKTNRGCLALAKKIGHPPSIAFALTARTGMCLLQGRAKLTLARANRALRFATDERLGFWEPMITVFHGWALSERGDRERGAAMIRDAIQRYRAAGNGILQVWLNVILAGALWKAGEWSESFDILERAMVLATETGEGIFEPELYRLEGQFRFEQATGAAGSSKTRSTGDRSTELAHAERCIREAVDRARRQKARMLELRSLVTLCRVQKRLRIPPEYDVLSTTYHRFRKDLDTPDLRRARKILASAGVV